MLPDKGDTPRGRYLQELPAGFGLWLFLLVRGFHRA